MNRLIHWIKSHQITAFFVITFAITRGAGFASLARCKGKFRLTPLAFVATCGKGSILVAGIAHAAANTAFAFFFNLDRAIFNRTAAVAARGLILADRMRQKLPRNHPAVYQA